MKSLIELPNIGKVLAESLEKAGIRNYDDLVNLGSVEAFIRLKQIESDNCYNRLYAIEGAIQETRWHNIPKEERENLKKEYLRLVEKYE
jgi:DNA transformation protein and related proteins